MISGMIRGSCTRLLEEPMDRPLLSTMQRDIAL